MRLIKSKWTGTNLVAEELKPQFTPDVTIVAARQLGISKEEFLERIKSASAELIFPTNPSHKSTNP